MAMSLGDAAAGVLDTRGADLYLVLATYNFGFWFNGKGGYVFTQGGEPAAYVWVDGRYQLYRGSRELVEETLGLREDLSGFYRLARSDPLLHGFAEKLPGWRLRTTTPWWAAVIGVCQQNTGFLQGWRMLYRLIKLYARTTRVDGKQVYLVPSPSDVLSRPYLLREAGTGYRAATIQGLARAFRDGEIDTGGCKGFRETLLGVKGVGSYTARLAAVLSLRCYDEPPMDNWVRRLAAEAYGVEPREAEEEWRRRWGRWSGLAVIALTIALDAVPIRKALTRLRRGILYPVPMDKPTPLTLWRYMV